MPINVIFLCLFLAVGTSHAVLLRRNIAGGRQFFISGMVAGKFILSHLERASPDWETIAFCITRILATVLRIAWACHPTNIHVGIAAMIFIYAGIPLLFLANLFFAQRIVRAQHPPFGWSKPVSIAFPVVIVITVATILCLIVAVIVSFYTLDTYSRNATREIQKYGATMLAIIAFLPFGIAGISSLVRRHPHIRMTKTTDKFGEGSMRAKVTIVLVSAVLLSLGAWYRAGTILAHPMPLMIPSDPLRPAPHPGYQSKACFYIFDFTIEIGICIFWLAVRIDKRFFVPDGTKGPFSYAGGFIFAGEAGNEKKRFSHVSNNQQDSQKEPSRPASVQSRASWAGSLSTEARNSKRQNRVSWGGVSRDSVKAGMGEDRKTVIPYPEGDVAADVTVDGMEKEMGWDPKSGKWATRPISGVSSIRPVSSAWTNHPSS